MRRLLIALVLVAGLMLATVVPAFAQGEEGFRGLCGVGIGESHGADVPLLPIDPNGSADCGRTSQ